MKKNNNSNLLKIDCKVNNNGFTVLALDKKSYKVALPPKIFSTWSETAKQFLVDNYVYARTCILGMASGKLLNYQTSFPHLKSFIDNGIKQELRMVSEINKPSTKELLALFRKTSGSPKISFKNKQAIKFVPRQSNNSSQKAILALSFGKDSLLSYGLAKEIGLKCFPVMCNIMEKYNYHEWQFKKKLFYKFIREQHQPAHLFSDNVDDVFFSPTLDNKIEDLHCANSMLTYALEMWPFADYFKSKYIIFGNERNFDDFFINKDGLKTYPSYDQFSGYTKKLNEALKKVTNNNIKIVSLIEPIYNLAEMKILFSRYQYLLKYVMSCYPENLKDRWCYKCPMCAKAYLYSVAVGGDPSKIGMNKNMFEMKYKSLYPIFSDQKNVRPYEKPPQVKEEQLLAFLLAYRIGFRGGLMDLFKEKYLTKTLAIEKRLRKKYFGIHKSVSLPTNLRKAVIKIYKEELQDLA